VLTAWSFEPIGAERAETFLALVATTTGAVASAQLLGRLRRDATRDPLTGLSNRHHFAGALERAAAADGRLAVGFVDVVGLRSVNEHHGHAVGDQALIALARRLRSVVGSAGARYGGDRFVFLLPGLSPANAAARADALLGGLSMPIALGVARLKVDVAVGLVTAVAPRPHDQLLRAADAATEQAAESGDEKVVHVDLDPLLGSITSEDRPSIPTTSSARRGAVRRQER
jgi:diguanylate cyclase (GGDEF)-like protein